LDGLLVVDKPVGPTSHDVVARVRRITGEPRIGHTGTLDPLASGVLPLVMGRATRLARFLSASTKRYVTTLCLGLSTDSGDAAGRPAGPSFEGPLPDAAAIRRALEAFRGTFLQRPPAVSAKRIGGARSYDLARREGAAHGRPEPVSVSAVVDLVRLEDRLVTLQVDCSPGFYVRALAHDLGERLGTGAHVVALRRIRSGEIGISDALTLSDIEAGGRARAVAHLVPLSSMPLGMPGLRLTAVGTRRARQGRDLGPSDVLAPLPWTQCPDPARVQEYVRLLDPCGDLLGVARATDTPGVLHPAVILG
jgi:tRNA pseudouridine55 synthase